MTQIKTAASPHFPAAHIYFIFHPDGEIVCVVPLKRSCKNAHILASNSFLNKPVLLMKGCVSFLYA